LRAAALRFWTSRLLDHHLPRSGKLIVRRQPDTYRTILLARRAADAGHARLASRCQAG
jgi:homoserine kinase type II